MNRCEFRELLRQKNLILDGATGTELIRRGMPAGISPEKWIVENPQVIKEIQNLYRENGSNIVYVPSFGGNRKKLAEHGLEQELFTLNQQLAQSAKSAAGENLVFGDLSPTGEFIAPVGMMSFEECTAIYREQAEALLAGGVDGFVIETMLDLQEARAALLGVRAAAPDFPVLITMTFDRSGRTLSGNTPESCLVALQSLGVDAFGCNCSSGPEDMVKIIRQLKAIAKIPLIAKPNAGVPQFVGGKTVFSMDAEAFGAFGSTLLEAGANLIGGCCGTTPGHIGKLAQDIKNLPAVPFGGTEIEYLSSSREVKVFSVDLSCGVLPEVTNGDYGLIFDAALDLAEYDILQVSGVEDSAAMLEILNQLSQVSTQCIKFCLENVEVCECALRHFCGRAQVESTNSAVMKTAEKYGAFSLK